MKKAIGYLLTSIPFILILLIMKCFLFEDSWVDFFIAWFWIIFSSIVVCLFFEITIGLGTYLINKDKDAE